MKKLVLECRTGDNRERKRVGLFVVSRAGGMRWGVYTAQQVSRRLSSKCEEITLSCIIHRDKALKRRTRLRSSHGKDDREVVPTPFFEMCVLFFFI